MNKKDFFIRFSSPCVIINFLLAMNQKRFALLSTALIFGLLCLFILFAVHAAIVNEHRAEVAKKAEATKPQVLVQTNPPQEQVEVKNKPSGCPCSGKK